MNQKIEDDIQKADDHILVCLSAAPSNLKIIDTAAKMANVLQARFTALYVRTGTKSEDSDKEKLEEQIRQLAKQVNAYREDGNLWMKMYFDIQTDYVNAVEKIYGKKKADIDAPENSSEKEYVVTPEGWILPKSLMDRDDT